MNRMKNKPTSRYEAATRDALYKPLNLENHRSNLNKNHCTVGRGYSDFLLLNFVTKQRGYYISNQEIKKIKNKKNQLI